jgi:NADPH2:quinone reductase
MKAWRVHEWGEPETMVLEEVPVPSVGPGEVRIRNRAAALNFFDVLQVQGKYQLKPPFPFIPGAEVAGVVDAVGEGVIGFRAGDRVLSMTRGNGFADYCSISASRVFQIPPGMSFEQAAAFPIAYHTSWFALTHRINLREGETLLVHAGASGVGMAAIQIGKALGARVLATAGAPAKCDFARAQGADEAFDYSNPDWIDRVKATTGGSGADVIFDPVGGEIFDQSLKCIAQEGRVLVIGFASGNIPAPPLNRVLLKNISIVGVLWGGYLQAHTSYAGEVQQKLSELYAARKIKPSTEAVYPFESAPLGLRDLANRRIMGKSVLSFGD